jgi:hypothetical protein
VLTQVLANDTADPLVSVGDDDDGDQTTHADAQKGVPTGTSNKRQQEEVGQRLSALVLTTLLSPSIRVHRATHQQLHIHASPSERN